MKSKTDILKAIQETAAENGGKPLGVARFKKETGIGPHDWEKYWARFGDAQKEAGFSPNQLQGAYEDGALLEKLISLARKLGKLPTYREMAVEHNSGAFPDDKVYYNRWKTKRELAKRVSEYCKGRKNCADILALCDAVPQAVDQSGYVSARTRTLGEVYLLRSGRYYKIGRTIDTVRRGNEIRIQLPERMTLIHSIQTDDPSGVEAYWHRRFEARRMQGEWFDLTAADVRAFKSWKRII